MADDGSGKDGGGGGGGGTGNQFSRAVITVCGVAALVASLLSFISIWFQLKNYRKPLLQRYVVRILLMVPIYSAASWASLTSTAVAFYVDPVRDVYEAFTLYTFFQLLINFLGGERALIVMMHGRAPVSHPWPLNHCLAKVDISDPHTFLAVKRGILQYAWLKPLLALATIVMKSTDTYQEGYLGLTSGYLWAGILYNLSVSLSLYTLAMFWVCMSADLAPFRPVPKFLCVKLIIFASYWQGFFLSILQFLGAIPNVRGYSQDNLAAAIQDALICCEMPIFAIAHWYAFSWHDYADDTISAARLPVKHALRDAFGPVDLWQDTKETFTGGRYEYRAFDARDDVLTHEASESRVARMREGMRYSRGGKGKYWLPPPGEGVDGSSRRPLLGEREDSVEGHGTFAQVEESADLKFGAPDEDDERLFASARALEFGDWNYPVVTAHVPSRERWRQSDPGVLTTAANRHLLHPTEQGRRHREHRLEERFEHKGKGSRSRSSRARKDSGGGDDRPSSSKSKPARAPVVAAELARQSSAQSGRSQLVDLVVEDEAAEEVERVRARKEGGAVWNTDEPQHFVRTYDDEDQGEDIRHGFEPQQLSVGGAADGAGDGADDDADDGARDRRRAPEDGQLYAPLDDGNPWSGAS